MKIYWNMMIWRYHCQLIKIHIQIADLIHVISVAGGLERKQT